MNASSLSAALRRGGFNPLGSGAPRSREGLRCSGAATGGAFVTADLDSPRAAASLSASVAEFLAEEGYAAERISPSSLLVTGKASA